MADDTKGKPADAGKDGKFEAPKTLEEAVALLESNHEEMGKIRKALKEANDEAKERKEKLRAIDQEKADKEAAALKEKGEFKALVDSLEPKAKRADALEAALKGYFDLEIADVPEDKRSLIPAGPVETQLTWLKQAKSQGIFGKPKEKPADSDQGKKGDPNTPEFLSWAPTDKRLESLSTEDYQRWKKHNKRDGNSGVSGPAGWGGGR